MPETIDLMERRERLAYAEAAVSTYCREFLAAREAGRAARQSASDAARRLGRARRELAEAQRAMAAAKIAGVLTPTIARRES